MFLIGFGAFSLGAASNFESIPVPIDCRSITCSLGLVVFTLDVVLIVVGVFLMLIAWLFGRLAQ